MRYGKVTAAVAITFSPLREAFDFVRLPWDFFLILVVLVIAYLCLAELGKARFLRAQPGAPSLSRAIESGEIRPKGGFLRGSWGHPWKSRIYRLTS